MYTKKTKVVATKEEIIADLKRVAQEYKITRMTITKYDEYGKYAYSRVIAMFKHWSIAVAAADLVTIKRKRKNKPDITAEIIADVKAVAATFVRDGLLQKEYVLKGKYNKKDIEYNIGSWKQVRIQAGLRYKDNTAEEIIEDILRVCKLVGKKNIGLLTYVKHRKCNLYCDLKKGSVWNSLKVKAGLKVGIITKEELIEDMKAVAEKLGSTNLPQNVYRVHGNYKSATIYLKFGSWKAAIASAGLMHDIGIPKADLLNDLKRVAILLNKNRVSMGEYDKYGKHGKGTFNLKFGNWNIANEEAGLLLNPYLSEKDMLDDLKRVANLISPVKKLYQRYLKEGKYSPSSFRYRFGTWNNGLEKAGLPSKKSSIVPSNKIMEQDLLNDINQLAKQCSPAPLTYDYYVKNSKYSISTIYHRFGSWNSILKKAGLPVEYKRKNVKKNKK